MNNFLFSCFLLLFASCFFVCAMAFGWFVFSRSRALRLFYLVVFDGYLSEFIYFFGVFFPSSRFRFFHVSFHLIHLLLLSSICTLYSTDYTDYTMPPVYSVRLFRLFIFIIFLCCCCCRFLFADLASFVFIVIVFSHI